MFKWTLDAPNGVFKSHDMSMKLRFASIAQCKFMQFVKPEPGYGKGKGDSITITRVANIAQPSDGRLAEGRIIPEDDVVLTTVAITVTEWGRSVPFTSLAKDLTVFDLENAIQRKLRDQMKLSMDKAAAGAFKQAKVVAVPDTSTSLTITTNGTPGATATSNLKLYHVEVIRDYMFSTLHVEPFEGDDYICLLNTKAKRGLIDDSAWVDWVKYTDPEHKYNGEIGRIENIRFIEVNNNNALANNKGSGGVLGEAVFFGADAVAMAVALDPELRAAIPQDFGRQKSVAWYGILEFGIVWDTANDGEARIVYLTSA
jgi:N4-gp56 family major capsid protein